MKQAELLNETMSNIIGFSILDVSNGAILATFPLTFPIGETVSYFEKHGATVTWTWAEEGAV